MSLWLRSAFEQTFPEGNHDFSAVDAVSASNPRFGDYQCNAAMSLAGVLKKSPREIAQSVVDNAELHQSLSRIEVAGHTDSDASEEHNLDLSQRRAEAVVDYLVDKGVERSRLIAKGYGEGSPIDTNETDEGKANNRRVEFNIVED